MARIADMDGRTDGAFTRLMGDPRLGLLLSKVAGAVSSSGNELERFIGSLVPDNKINTLANIARRTFINSQWEIVLSPTKPKAGDRPGIIADFGKFDHTREFFQIIELKDGDSFDTDKAPRTKKDLQTIVDYVHTQTGYGGEFYVCSFNATSKDRIVTGFRNHFQKCQVMTGCELCDLLGVDYYTVMQYRELDQPDNRTFFYTLIEVAKNGADLDQFVDVAEEIRTGQLRLKW